MTNLMNKIIVSPRASEKRVLLDIRFLIEHLIHVNKMKLKLFNKLTFEHKKNGNLDYFSGIDRRLIDTLIQQQIIKISANIDALETSLMNYQRRH